MLKSISKSEVEQKVCRGGWGGVGDSSEGNGGRGGRLVVMFPMRTVICPVHPPPPQHWTWGCILPAHYYQFQAGEQAQTRRCLVGCLMRLRAAACIHSAGLSLVQFFFSSSFWVGGGLGHSVQTYCETLQEASTLETSEATDLLRASLLFLQTDRRDWAKSQHK